MGDGDDSVVRFDECQCRIESNKSIRVIVGVSLGGSEVCGHSMDLHKSLPDKMARLCHTPDLCVKQESDLTRVPNGKTPSQNGSHTQTYHFPNTQFVPCPPVRDV